MKEDIIKILDELRPNLQADGGDVELVGIDEKKGIVRLKLKGACQGCPMSQMTLQDGIGRVLKAKVKGVKEIEAV